MKNKLALLLLLFVSFNICLADEAEKLPEVPWRAIAETNRTSNQVRWQTNVYVKLFGNYSKSDSMMVGNAILDLNKLTKTIHISMSSIDRGNLELFFIDSTNRSNYKQIITLKPDQKSTWFIRHSYNSELLTQAVNINLIPKGSKQNFLTNTLAFNLYPEYWHDEFYYKKKHQNEAVYESIFRSIGVDDRDKLFLGEMQDFDKKLLMAVYSPDFDKNLKIAQKQFFPFVIPEWLRVNPYSFLLLPFLLLLLLLTAVYIKISSRIIQHVSNSFIRFNIDALVLGFFFAFVVAFYISLSYVIKYNHSFSRVPMITATNVMVILIFGLPTVNLLRFIEIIIHRNTHRKLLRIGLIFLTTGLLPFSAFFAMYVYGRNQSIMLSNEDIKMFSELFMGCMVVAAFRALISYFFFKEKDLILENETKLSNLRELKTKAELNALHSRINPHFLYNSLNSIAGLAHEDADKTEHMALSLSKLFRYSINRDQSDWTTFKEEMEMIKIYLEVEKVRFDDRLSYSVELPKELEDYKIPRFMIQPLVENAVKHGISKSVESGKIKVAVTQEGRKIFISVSDDGPFFPNDLTPGFGIQSIYDKLEILYKDKFEMNFTNTPHKQVLIKLS